MQSVLWPG